MSHSDHDDIATHRHASQRAGRGTSTAAAVVSALFTSGCSCFIMARYAMRISARDACEGGVIDVSSSRARAGRVRFPGQPRRSSTHPSWHAEHDIRVAHASIIAESAEDERSGRNGVRLMPAWCSEQRAPLRGTRCTPRPGQAAGSENDAIRGNHGRWKEPIRGAKRQDFAWACRCQRANNGCKHSARVRDAWKTTHKLALSGVLEIERCNHRWRCNLRLSQSPLLRSKSPYSTSVSALVHNPNLLTTHSP